MKSNMNSLKFCSMNIQLPRVETLNFLILIMK
jgi:hypothetical protein